MGVDAGERKFSLGSQREADMRSRQDQLPHGETEAKEKSKPEQPAVRRAEDDAYLALKRVHTSFVAELYLRKERSSSPPRVQILLQPSAKVILAACDALAESEQYEKFLGAAVRYDSTQATALRVSLPV